MIMREEGFVVLTGEDRSYAENQGSATWKPISGRAIEDRNGNAVVRYVFYSVYRRDDQCSDKTKTAVIVSARCHD